ncbi:MAG TPA: hypothetical protein VKA68_09640 [bacterium]|nr:hypothetical protein [bacterium]
MLIEALQLLIQLNGAVFLNIANALEVAGYIIILALVTGLPIGMLTGVHTFRFRRLVLYLLHIWLFLPATGLGIFISYLHTDQFISPLGFIFWGALLTIPIIAGLTADVFSSDSRATRDETLALGASRWQMYATMARQKREQIYGVVTVGIARVFTEIGGFYLMISFVFKQGFPSVPVFELSNAPEHLAVAIGLFLFGVLVYSGLHIVQFKKDT